MSPTKHEPPTQAVQSFLIAIAEELAADEKRVLQQAGKMIETQEEFAAFHDAFFKKLAAKVVENVGKATDSVLEKHGIPEGVVMKVREFQETADVLPRILPRKVVALPRDVVDELWKEETKKRRKEWREEGEQLLTSTIQAVAKKGGRKQVFLYERGQYNFVAFLHAWVSDFPAPPRFLAVPEENLSWKLKFTEVDDLITAFENAGYKRHEDKNSMTWLTW